MSSSTEPFKQGYEGNKWQKGASSQGGCSIS